MEEKKDAEQVVNDITIHLTPGAWVVLLATAITAGLVIRALTLAAH